MPTAHRHLDPARGLAQGCRGPRDRRAYLARCVQSWRDCGFAPVTVNSVNEALHPLIADLGIEVVRVPRDAAAITGRPHVFLQDLLDAARSVSEERVFIVNADIEVEMTQAARERLANLGPMQTVIKACAVAITSSKRRSYPALSTAGSTCWGRARGA